MNRCTRTSDGTISRVSYDYSTLKLKGETKSLAPPQEHHPGHRKRDNAHFDNGLVRLAEKSVLEPLREDICQGAHFIPPTSFGEMQTVGSSAIEYAERKIAQWKIVRDAHEKNLPHLLPQIDQRMHEAREVKRNLLDSQIWHSTVVDHEKRRKKVSARVAVLEDALHTSQFVPERENIQAAIDGYRSGDISYSTKYTLIWHGRIVDRADTYTDFTVDRSLRLDRYLKAYGPHWLWWESPLEVHPNNAPRQSRCSTLDRNVAYHGLGQYYVEQVFWKRADWVRRLPLGFSSKLPPNIAENFLTSEEGKVYCQSEGPKLVYTSLLDSGATYPSLCPGDFHDLGIDADNYAAQTIETLDTANGTVEARTYELFVSPVQKGTLISLVDENDAVWPYHGKYLGGLCPVTTALNTITEPNADGFLPNPRLSGLLPFLACYITSTPTRNCLFLGEDRNDVMGGHKTPGHRRWDITMPSTQTVPRDIWRSYGHPKIRFSHRNGLIINQDREDISHASTTTIRPGEVKKKVIQHNPRAECDAAEAQRQAEGAAAAPPSFNAF